MYQAFLTSFNLLRLKGLRRDTLTIKSDDCSNDPRRIVAGRCDTMVTVGVSSLQYGRNLVLPVRVCWVLSPLVHGDYTRV